MEIDNLKRAAGEAIRSVPQTSNLKIKRGSPLPLGASLRKGGYNFAVFSKHATSATLVVFLPGPPEAVVEIPLDSRVNRTGEIWHALIEGVDASAQYAWRMDRVPNAKPALHRQRPQQLLLDPYAKAVRGRAKWGAREQEAVKGQRCLIVDNSFDWGIDQPLHIPLRDSVIYEMHVRGFTRHQSSGVSRPGTFASLVEKIPYLKSLGVTAVELLPVHEFDEASPKLVNPLTGERLLNFWGYDPISFFSPMAAYASDSESGGPVREFKSMVKTFHEAGIEVILDVVFNHTGEADDAGPTYSFRGIDNAVYYMLDPRTGEYLNYSGCGNTLNCNHPVVRELIAESLRYWVTEMHVDGFRFDLASILGRGQDGSVLANPPLIEGLSNDPILAGTKLIAEAWDAAGLYQVGTFPAGGRWAEWNGKFRDDIRRFVKGDPGMVSALATRLAGSADLYHTSQREPWHSINFVTCHDGFTLADLVSYNEKHNEMNGENNRDGHNDNLSWNCGEEGPSTAPEINRLRRRQIRNFATLLMMSQGVPMLYGGDEMGRSQKGNNNAYCQDNDINWVDWRLIESNETLVRFFRNLIRFRCAHPLLRRGSFTPDDDPGASRIEWNGMKVGQPDWSHESRSLAMHLRGTPEGVADHVYVIAHAHWEPAVFELPAVPGWRWQRFVDTTLDSPNDITVVGGEAPLSGQTQYSVGPRSVVVLAAAPVTALLAK